MEINIIKKNKKTFFNEYFNFFRDIFGTKNFILLVLICFLSILLDAFSVALIIPLMNIIQSPDYVLFGFNISDYLLKYNLKSIEFVTTIFLVYIILKNILLFFLNYYKSSLIFQVQSFLSKEILLKYINKEFNIFTRIQFSEINRNSVSEVGHLVSLLSISLDLLAEILVVTLVVIIIAYANYNLISFFFLYSFFGYLIYRFTRLFLYELGKQRIDNEKNRITNIQNIYNSIKEIKTYNAEKFFIKNYDVPNKKVAFTHAMEHTINPVSKYIFEILTVTSVLIYIFFIANSNIISDAILIFAAMFRIFPSFNKIISSLQKLNIHKKSFKNIYELYYEKHKFKKNKETIVIPNIKTFEFKLNSIEIEKNKFIKKLKVNFSSKDKLILIKGKSGLGKSVFLNCMSGILKSDCKYVINNKEYYGRLEPSLQFFSYNSQNAPLLNDSILKNIIFVEDENAIDKDKLKLAIKITGLKDIISSYPNKLNTLVSDRGHNFSGGQAQRITLARTIYQNKKIMILDESLSALDNESQIKILDNIKKYFKGIVLLVSHDRINYQNFDKVIKLDKI